MSAGISNETIAEALQRAKQLAATVREDTPGKRPAEDDPNELIGRGGENITNIQASTGCRVQMAPDAQGRPVRPCTLQGTKSSIEAKAMIQGVIERSGGRPPPNKPMMGGGGMMPGGMGMVADGMGGGGGGGMIRGGGGQVTKEMIIPGPKCGLVIGKGGETIKQVQEKAGVKIILIQESQNAGHMPKPLRIMGDPDKVEYAKALVEEIMNSKDDNPPSMRNQYHQQHNDYGGPATKSIGEVIVPRSSVGMIIGKGGDTIRRLSQESGAKIQFKQDEDPNGPERTAIIQGTPDQIQRATHLISDLVNKSGETSDIFYMHIPAMKTGLVIGRGGETIKQIAAESGAHVELSRDPPPSSNEKVFIIKGTPYQIHHAQHIIRIKVGDLAPGTPVPPFQGAGGPSPGVDQFSGGFPNSANFPQAGAWNQNFQQPQADPNAAWSAYYNQYQNFYGQGAGPMGPQAGAPQPMQQQQQQPQQPVVPTSAAAPTINPQTGQPDYSAQWAEYYRSLGMHEQAAMIEQQAKANQVAAAAAAAGGAPGGAPGGGQPAAFQGFPYGQQGGAPQYNYGGPGGGQPQPAYQY